jgi:hypothetical protein
MQPAGDDDVDVDGVQDVCHMSHVALVMSCVSLLGVCEPAGCHAWSTLGAHKRAAAQQACPSTGADTTFCEGAA